MSAETWEFLPEEVRKMLVEKRKAASQKYQGSITVLDPSILWDIWYAQTWRVCHHSWLKHINWAKGCGSLLLSLLLSLRLISYFLVQRYNPCGVRIAVPSAIVASPSYSAFFCLIRRDKPADFLAHPRRNPYICTMEKQEINTSKAIAQSKTQLGLAYAPNLEPSSAVMKYEIWNFRPFRPFRGTKNSISLSITRSHRNNRNNRKGAHSSLTFGRACSRSG